jgi:hypothetical protein
MLWVVWFVVCVDRRLAVFSGSDLEYSAKKKNKNPAKKLDLDTTTIKTKSG